MKKAVSVGGGNGGFLPFAASPSTVGSPGAGAATPLPPWAGVRAVGRRCLSVLGRRGHVASALPPAAFPPALRLPSGASFSASSAFAQLLGRGGGVPFPGPLPGRGSCGFGPARNARVGLLPVG